MAEKLLLDNATGDYLALDTSADDLLLEPAAGGPTVPVLLEGGMLRAGLQDLSGGL